MQKASNKTILPFHRVKNYLSLFRVRIGIATVMVIAAWACNTGDGTGSDPSGNGTSAGIAPPTREEILLIKRMENASVEEIKEFMREEGKRELPASYVTPQYIVDAGNAQAASAAIGQRFPEFYMKGGLALIESVGKHPVRYRQILEETKALRRHYQKEPKKKEEPFTVN